MSERKIVVVTGASAGVGRATARIFAENGFDVALLARGEAGLAGAAGRPTKVVGSWNKMLVVAGRLFPELGNQYAALGAWGTQFTDKKVSEDRPVNLHKPADAGTDYGAHGIFDHKAGGFLDPSFIRKPANHRPYLCHCPWPDCRR